MAKFQHLSIVSMKYIEVEVELTFAVLPVVAGQTRTRVAGLIKHTGRFFRLVVANTFVVTRARKACWVGN